MDTQTHRPKKLIWISIILVLSLVLIGGILLLINQIDTQNTSPTANPLETHTDNETYELVDTRPETHPPVLTALPLGDNKTSSSPKIGYVYTCQTSFNGGGAFTQGPWIDTENSTWNLTQKISVDGDVAWPQATWNTEINGETRTIESKDLPYGHNTGSFPVATNDDAYNYDRNPNSIAAQTISFQVPRNPTLTADPSCVGGEVGIATTGVLIFSAFDAAGRDAVATEIQDKCEGHPQAGDYYHYHGYSSCFNDTSAHDEHSDLLGYAFDGFGIFGLKSEGGNELSSSDLDQCHGHTHEVDWDGELTEMYHYHMTQDFPYTVSCFRGETSVNALSSGEGGGQPGGVGGPPPRR